MLENSSDDRKPRIINRFQSWPCFSEIVLISDLEHLFFGLPIINRDTSLSGCRAFCVPVRPLSAFQWLQLGAWSSQTINLKCELCSVTLFLANVPTSLLKFTRHGSRILLGPLVTEFKDKKAKMLFRSCLIMNLY